jgi:hemerythrin
MLYSYRRLNTMYVWDDSLKTGNEMIDSQHKQLFAAINSVLQVVDEKNHDELKKSLDFLNEYTIKHFFDEEKLQVQYNYPDYPNHKKLHENFKVVIRDLCHQQIMKGITDDLAREIKNQVGDWLVTHIKIQDVKLAEHIRGTGKL